LVESAILAAGSMCGSSVAPGGGEGTMIKGVSVFICLSVLSLRLLSLLEIVGSTFI
jgi:hypothetical protein